MWPPFSPSHNRTAKQVLYVPILPTMSALSGLEKHLTLYEYLLPCFHLSVLKGFHMSATTLPDRAPMTPGEVLEVFMAAHHVTAAFEEVEHYCPMSFDMTVADWRLEMDYVDHNQLGMVFNDWFKTDFTLEQWSQVFHPEKEKTLRGVCELIASKGVKPKYHPVTILGSKCLPAGIFLSLRKYLRQSGLDVSNLRPSTPLSHYFDSRDHCSKFISALTRIHPRVFMDFRFDKTRDKLLNASILVFTLSLILTCIPLPATALVGFPHLILTFSILMIFISRHFILHNKYPTYIGIKGIETFKDLSLAIMHYDDLPPVKLDS